MSKKNKKYCLFAFFFVILQPKTNIGHTFHMKHSYFIRPLVVLSVLMCLFVSCNNFRRQSHKIETLVHLQQQRADDLIEDISRTLSKNDFDSLTYYTHLADDIILYIYRDNQLVYWTDSWLSSSYLPLNDSYDSWQFAFWRNAQGICKRTKVGNFHLLTVIPIKHHYSVNTSQITNSFIAPFDGKTSWTLTPRRGTGSDYFPIHSQDGEYLFSVQKDVPYTTNNTVDIANFSYRPALSSDSIQNDMSKRKLTLYYGVTLALILILLSSALYHLIRCRGIKGMTLAGRLQLTLTPVMLLALVSTFVLSLIHTRQVYLERQHEKIQAKAQYIQRELQTMYFWDMQLTPAHQYALNVDLKDMSYDFKTDIHVYDMNGQLLGSSCNEIFELGLVSHLIAPEAFFTNNPNIIQYEQMGDMRYLAAYTEFLNGGLAQIGYIVIPSFISQEEMNTDIAKFVTRLLPLYIILLLISIVVVWLVARGVSLPLTTISSQLKNYRLGEKGKHISYFFNDEVGDLIRHYNEMMDALAESTQRLARSEREGAWRTMARQVAHEINNPLTPMKLTIQQLQRHKGTDRFDEYFDRSTRLLIEQIETLGCIATSFSSFAKMPEVTPRPTDVAAKLYDFITLMRNNDANIPIRYVGPEHGVIVIADPEQITQVFTNIVRNAIQAMENIPQRDIIIILKQVPDQQRVKKDLATDSQWIEISISDNGPGIPKDIQNKVFIPNFTTKNTGAGLGLAISKNIVDACGGQITFLTSEKGTTFYIYLKKEIAYQH